ncbi:MAG: asparagine synthase (glutamine-hydrolyzing), partial [Bacillota bacterium]
MCGITGWVDWDEDLTRKNQILLRMTNHLAHRGPDALSTWSSPHAAFGHRRLVVVDPEGGEQPMTRSRGNRTYTITYNGELYNTLEIRRELEVRGHHLRTRNSDTEVLLLAYIEWGKACLDRLNGIFAFAIWDEAEQSLFMARDRLGVKPLFYFQRGSMFLFASELKALLAHPQVSPALDREGLAEVLVMAPSRTPGHGVFHNVRELRPGYFLEYTRRGISTSKYWRLVSKPHLDDLPTTAHRVRELLEDSVRRQLVSDVPIGTLLSGGLDSSAITAFAARVFKEEGQGALRTFSVDYRGNDEYFRSNQFQPDADIPWIRMVSGYVGSEHHHVTLDNLELAAALIPAVRASDFPGMADIDSSLYLFCREIKKTVTVGLSGECADEILGGYPWFNREG